MSTRHEMRRRGFFFRPSHSTSLPSNKQEQTLSKSFAVKIGGCMTKLLLFYLKKTIVYCVSNYCSFVHFVHQIIPLLLLRPCRVRNQKSTLNNKWKNNYYRSAPPSSLPPPKKKGRNVFPVAEAAAACFFCRLFFSNLRCRRGGETKKVQSC